MSAQCSRESAEWSRFTPEVIPFGPGFRYHPQWSPDAKKIVFIDQAMRIHLFDMETKQTTEVGRQLWAYEGDLVQFSVSWSADSRWFSPTEP